MLRSICARIVMGAVLLTLLTVSAVGVVALLLMQRYMAQQERAYLTANAQAIAQQAVLYMTPVKVAPPLQQLAQTAAFLGDVTVRIVDEEQKLLADSGQIAPYPGAKGVMAAPIYFRVAADPVVQAGDLSSVANTMWAAALPASPAVPLLSQEANVIVVQKSPSFWGDRLIFESEAPLPVTGTLPLDFEVKPWMSSVIMEGVGNDVPAVARGEVAVLSMNETVVYEPADEETGLEPAHRSIVWERKWAQGSTTGLRSTALQAAGLAAARVVTAPIELDGAVLGFVELGRATTMIDEPLGAIRRALGIAAGASALLAIGVGLVMSRTLTAPIQNLALAATAMSSGDLTARAPVVGRDELASLARQFNHMADALHRSFVELAAERDTLRRFVADASHELRTPITALRTFNELLQGPAQEDRSAQHEFLAECHMQITRLEWITRNLLDLSRWDGGMETLTMCCVDLGDLVAAVVAPFRTAALEKQIELDVLVPQSSVMVEADAARLGMAVGNLLDNALKFTAEGGRVEVGVQGDAEEAQIWVSDTGMGIGGEELPHIFDRFYRSPRATQPGSGLGLAIVERIVSAHRATLCVESQEGVGSRFTVRLRV